MVRITLRMARENLQISVREASDRTGVPISTLRRWEKNADTVRRIDGIKLCQFYMVSAEHILWGPESEALELNRKAGYQLMLNEDNGESNPIMLAAQLDLLCKEAVLNSKTEALFQEILAYARSYCVSEPERIRGNMIEIVKRRLALAIKRNFKHCGQPVNVSGSYNFDTQLHAIKTDCPGCGQCWIITERRENA